jgi:hypothetical protein
LLGAGTYAVAQQDNGTSPSSSADTDAQIPGRVEVVDGQGNIAGWADTAAIRQMPSGAYEDWLRQPIPVTKTQDPSSDLVGYQFRTAGFVDLATYNSPTFDLNALVEQAQAQSTARSQQYLQSVGQSK